MIAAVLAILLALFSGGGPAQSGAVSADRFAAPAAPLFTLNGTATWYRTEGLVGAAGPRLRAQLGKDWRGKGVVVCTYDGCVVVVLTDWCACPHTLIDLSDQAFSAIADLPEGRVKVTVDPWTLALPATDTED